MKKQISTTTVKPAAKKSTGKSAVKKVAAPKVVLPPAPILDGPDDDDPAFAPVPVTDPREQIVTCRSCGIKQAKRHMTVLGQDWFCVELDECRGRRGLPPRTAIADKAKTATEKVKQAKTPKAKAEPKPRATKFSPTDTISILVAANPKRQGSTGWAHFNLYQEGMTVECALASGVTREDLNWDTAHNFISIGGK